MPITRSQAKLAKKTALLPTPSTNPTILATKSENSPVLHFPFLKLPGELRDMIYGYYFPHHEHIDVHPRHRAGRRRDGEATITPAIDILLVNKQLAIEGTRALYTSHNVFIFHLSESHGLELYPSVPRSVSVENFRLMRFLRVKLCFGYAYKFPAGTGPFPPDVKLDWWYKGSDNQVERRKSYVADLTRRLLVCHNLTTLHLELDDGEEYFEYNEEWDTEDFSEHDWRRVLEPLCVGLGLEFFQVSCGQDRASEADPHDSPSIDDGRYTGAEMWNWLRPVVIGPKVTKGSLTIKGESGGSVE